MSKLISKIMIERKKLHMRNITMMTISFMLMGTMVMWILTGCSMFVKEPEYRMVPNELDTLCCIPDPDFPHSCDGWLLCDRPIDLEEVKNGNMGN
jgi:hypothetical protein